MLGIGIDTGGTCTDAVIYDLQTKHILGAGKALTTKYDLKVGIAEALDQLPGELLKQAESVSLSTTLATNACVENKGSRAKLLMIGFEEEMIRRLMPVLAEYGTFDLSRMVILDAKPENLFQNPFDPDWEMLKTQADTLFAECDAVGVVQCYPDANGARFEKTAVQILKEKLTIPVTSADAVHGEPDILKRCASTLLNARLIPLIREFMEAVHGIMEEKGLHVPLSIVRSNGTLMSEEMALAYPVETLLCGPAASVIGGLELAGKESALLLDMGGTTTDIAVIRDREPVMTGAGIRIGKWNTTIRGLQVNAIGLGGDTAVRCRDGNPELDVVRVIPVSVLADRWEQVLPALKKLNEQQTVHTRPIYEFYVLQKSIAGKSGYSEAEQQACRALEKGPLITRDMAAALGTSLYHMQLDRLEQEGVILRSGLTPTDIMVLKGDFDRYRPEAAEELLQYFARNLNKDPEWIADRVYDLVVKRMYMNLGRVLLQSQYPGRRELYREENLEALLQIFYEQAVHTESATIAKTALTTDLPLIGVGAPIHVFLPRVAELFRTEAVVPEYSHVANALGACACRREAHYDLLIRAEYEQQVLNGYYYIDRFAKKMYKDPQDAVAHAKEDALREVLERARFQGVGDDPDVTFTMEEKRIGNLKDGLLLEVLLHAVARG